MDIQAGDLMAFKIDETAVFEVVKVISDTEVEFKKPDDISGVTAIWNPEGFVKVER